MAKNRGGVDTHDTSRRRKMLSSKSLGLVSCAIVKVMSQNPVLRKSFAILVLLAGMVSAPLSLSPAGATSCNYQSCPGIDPVPLVLVQKGVGQVLSKGDLGNSVAFLQKQLNKVLHAGLQVDGIFGTKTQAAVKQLQGVTGERKTGVVVPQTWAAALGGRFRVGTHSILKYGHRGPLVNVLQQLLNVNGHRVKVDGVFGTETWKAVVAFKERVGLHSGANKRAVVNTQVWNALNLRNEL